MLKSKEVQWALLKAKNRIFDDFINKNKYKRVIYWYRY